MQARCMGKKKKGYCALREVFTWRAYVNSEEIDVCNNARFFRFLTYCSSVRCKSLESCARTETLQAVEWVFPAIHFFRIL